MNSRLLIVIVVLLVLLFALGVGMGAGNAGSVSAGEPPALVQFLGVVGGGPARLRGEDLAGASPAACLDQMRTGRLTLPRGAVCTFFVRASRAPVRTVQVDIAAGQVGQAVVEPADRERLTVRQRLDGRRSFDAILFQEGGELQIGCLNAGNASACVVTVR